jgi:hypothetical protein
VACGAFDKLRLSGVGSGIKVRSKVGIEIKGNLIPLPQHSASPATPAVQLLPL